jgi:hypothetical protein
MALNKTKAFLSKSGLKIGLAVVALALAIWNLSPFNTQSTSILSAAKSSFLNPIAINHSQAPSHLVQPAAAPAQALSNPENTDIAEDYQAMVAGIKSLSQSVEADKLYTNTATSAFSDRKAVFFSLNSRDSQ